MTCPPKAGPNITLRPVFGGQVTNVRTVAGVFAARPHWPKRGAGPSSRHLERRGREVGRRPQWWLSGGTGRVGETALTAISGSPTIGPTRWGSSSRREWTTALDVGRGARGPVLSAVLEDYDIERVYWNGATRGSQSFANFLIGVNAERANVIVPLDRDQSDRPGRRALGCR